MFETLHHFGEKTAFITEDDGAISYRQFVGLADRIAKKISVRTVVFCICSNDLGSVAAYVGFLRNKIVPILLPATIDSEALKILELKYRPSFIWAPLNWKERFKNCETVVTEVGYALYSSNMDSTYELNPALALLMTTSGSTGSKQMVRISYANLEANSQSIIEGLRLSSKDVPITTLPMSYVFGLSIINTHLVVGGTIILSNRSLMDKYFWTMLKSKKATTFGGVPYTYEMIRRLGFNVFKETSINQLLQAGGRLHPDFVKDLGGQCHQMGIQFFVMYGQTEATSRISILPSEFSELKPDSIGLAIPGGKLELDFDLTIANESKEKIGELIYSGPNVSLGYAFDYTDLSKSDENSGRLRTGDLATVDQDGFYYIVGRRKRFIKLYGNRINLNEVEEFIQAEGLNAACIGVDDNLKIYVENAGGHDTLKIRVAGFLGINQRAISVLHIENLPRLESGKVAYSKLEGTC